MSSPRSKAYRKYRAAVYVVFIVLVTFLGALPFMGVVRGLVAMADVEAPERAAIVTSAPDAPLSRVEAEACLDAFQSLRSEMDTRFAKLGELAGRKGRDALGVWSEETRLWEATRASVAEECKLDHEAGGPLAEALSPVARGLERVSRAYSTHATRLVIEDASIFEDLNEAFEDARVRLSREP